ncbi:non-ribosomal peptide synthetase [Thozetella sp. PMI_491]|nr:non-ribosomal peptide synthetase [Thozetella sp. PMI_491]
MLSRTEPRPNHPKAVSSNSTWEHPILGSASPNPLGTQWAWHNVLTAAQLANLVTSSHALPAVLPASGYVALGSEAAFQFFKPKVVHRLELEQLVIEADIRLSSPVAKIELVLESHSVETLARRGDRTHFFEFHVKTKHEGGLQSHGLGSFMIRTWDDFSYEPLRSNADPLMGNQTKHDLSPAGKRLVKQLPMSYGQSGFWFMGQLVDDPTLFNGCVSFLITGNLDVSRLAEIVRDLGVRHEGLRTCFFCDEAQKPIQGIMAESPLFLETKTISSELEAHQQIAEFNDHIYDLAGGQTLRMALLSESATKHHLIIGYQHINIDGSSIIAIKTELPRAYAGEMLPPPLQYAEFSETQQERVRTGQFAESIAFWKKKFQTLPDVLPILAVSQSTLRPRPSARKTYRHVKAKCRIPSALTSKVKALAKRSGKSRSPFSIYLTVFQILLSRLANQDDMCIGVASANRHHDAGALDTVGILLNLFPLRLRTSVNKSFRETMLETSTEMLSALAHSAVPFDVILDEVGARRDAGYNPLFQAFINYIPVQEKAPFGDGFIENKEYQIGETIYDIMLAVIDPPVGDAFVSIMVQRELYTENDAEVLLDCFLNLMDAFTSNSELLAGEPQMFNKANVEKAIQLGQGESPQWIWLLPRAARNSELLGPGTMVEEIDAVSANSPNVIALKDSHGAALSYSEMKDRSYRIAQALSRLGVPPKSRVAMLQEPTVDWICSMLAIWRLGCTYVPLEVTQGAARLSIILNDARPAAIIMHNATLPLLEEMGPGATTAIINISTISDNTEKSTLEDRRPTSTDEAIVLYTSGSTGIPKGISLPHRMITNTIKGYMQAFPMEPQTVLQQIALSFDVSWWQSLLGLQSRGTIFVAGQDVRRDPVALTEIISTQNITMTLAVPSEATSWLQHGETQALCQSKWSLHISAGEELRYELLDKFRGLQKLDLRIVNAYGPAETIVPHAHKVRYQHPNLGVTATPIGRTMPNYSVYIMDAQLHPLPAGVPGQVVIGGGGVATGYVGQPELTAARFPVDRFAPSHFLAQGWTHMHLSGDRGYMRDDGVFVALGRMTGDTQVKLRGQRFELREVEAAIISAGEGDISEAIAHIRSRPNGSAASTFLVAHVVLSPEIQERHGIRGRVVDSMLQDVVEKLPLPPYMVPSSMISLTKMPLSHHGKVDRKALSTLPLSEAPNVTAQTPPTENSDNSLEKELEQIWRLALTGIVGDKKLGPSSDFFLSGGNSLLLIKVQSEITRRLGKKLPLIKLFEANTLGKMAALISGGFQPELTHTSQEMMKRIWQDVLHRPADAPNLGPDSDFFASGGNSLLLVNVQAALRRATGRSVPLVKLFGTSTLGRMALLLDAPVPQNAVKSTQETFIDWEKEVALESYPITDVGTRTRPMQHAGRTLEVALTGASGFLGRHILKQLVADPSVKTIHCIAVRDPSKMPAPPRKVIVYQGDLKDQQLGLTMEESSRIFSSVSIIIHNGADVSFLRGYKTLRAANVLSTKTLVRLAIENARGQALPHFHFVSTAGITQLGTGELFEESLAMAQPRDDSNGYVVSKWVSEKYIENASSSLGLPAFIHRPSFIVGIDAPHLDVMHNLLHFAKLLRSVPEVPAVDRWLQFVGIEDVAREILADIRGSFSKPQQGISYRNHCGHEENWVRMDQLGEYLERQHRTSFSSQPLQSWVADAQRAGMPVEVAEYLNGLVDADEATRRSWLYPRVRKGTRATVKSSV